MESPVRPRAFAGWRDAAADAAANATTLSPFSPTEQDEDALAILYRLQTLDLSQALQRAASNARLLLKLLQRFYHSYPDFSERLTHALNVPENLTETKADLHGFKGVAANLGLTALFEAAEALESNLASPQACQVLVSAWQAFAQEMEAIAVSSGSQQPEGTLTALVSALLALQTKIQAYDLDALEDLEALLQHYPSHQAVLQALLLSLQNLDYAETETRLATLIKTLTSASDSV